MNVGTVEFAEVMVRRRLDPCGLKKKKESMFFSESIREFGIHGSNCNNEFALISCLKK